MGENNIKPRYMQGAIQAKSAGFKEDKDRSDGWVWKCSSELKNMLETLGMFEEMNDIMTDIHYSTTKHDAEKNKARLSVLKTAIDVAKGAIAVDEKSGTDDEDKGYAKIEISLTRTDE